MRPLDFSPHVDTPERPPRAWFEKPADLDATTYLTVTDDGHVRGRFYSSGVPLLSADDDELLVPHPSSTGYQLFHRGAVECDDGSIVKVGSVTLGGHDGASSGDDPETIIASVVAGDDEQGGWYSGALVPTATEFDLVLLRRSQLSAYWVPMSAAWFEWHGAPAVDDVELTALCAVVTGRAILWRPYKGRPPTLHRKTIDELEARDRGVRRELVAICDKHPGDPAAAIQELRNWARVDETRDARRRIDRLPPAALPQESVPEVLASSTRRTTP
jgi:hypothetical protein